MGLGDEIEYIANVNTRPLLKEEALSTHIFELFWVRCFLTQMIFLFIFEVRISY